MRKECIIQWKRFKHLKEKNDRTWREGEGKIGRVRMERGERGKPRRVKGRGMGSEIKHLAGYPQYF